MRGGLADGRRSLSETVRGLEFRENFLLVLHPVSSQICKPGDLGRESGGDEGGEVGSRSVHRVGLCTNQENNSFLNGELSPLLQPHT